MIDNTDQWVIRCNNFYDAAKFAVSQKWTAREWSWAPAYTSNNTIQIFKRCNFDEETDGRILSTYQRMYE